MTHTLPTYSELLSVLVNSNEIQDSTRRGIVRALTLARDDGRDFPTIADCVQASVDEGSDLAPTAAAWGLVLDANSGEWLDSRFVFEQPERDDFRHGDLPTHECALLLMAFSLGCGCPVPFSYSYTLRRPPRRSE